MISFYRTVASKISRAPVISSYRLISHISDKTDSKKPFKVIGVQQIAIGSIDKELLKHFWGDLLGLEKIGHYKSEKENVDEDIYNLGEGLNSIEIDLMQPIDPEKSPKVHIPSLNHIGLWIDDLPKCISYLTAKGVIFTPAGHDVAFIHPKSAVGVLVELVQYPNRGKIVDIDSTDDLS